MRFGNTSKSLIKQKQKQGKLMSQYDKQRFYFLVVLTPRVRIWVLILKLKVRFHLSREAVAR